MKIFTNIKEQRGAASVLVIVTILTFFLILTGVYFTITAMQKAQLKSDIHIQSTYKNDVNNIDNVYAEVLTKLKVGSIVNYNPRGTTYNWNANYATSLTDYTDVNKTLNSESFNINRWKVLSINETTGQVEMVPTVPTSGKVTLQGAQGYNNAVYLLNEACSRLYSDSSKGITARSINIKDIENIIKSNGYVPGTQGANGTNYGNQIESAYDKSYSYYPTIYAKEINSVIDENKKTSGLGLDEQEELIEREENRAIKGCLQASTSIQPYQTAYYISNTNFSNYLGQYKNIILPSQGNTAYWVASRSTNNNISSQSCEFSVCNIIGDSLSYSCMLNSNGDMNKVSLGIFPVVSVNAERISGNNVDGFTVN